MDETPQITVSRDNLYLQVVAPPWEKRRCSKMPGVRQVNPTTWRFPATPSVAAQLIERFHDIEFTYDEGFRQLVIINRRIDQVQRVKTATSFIPIPEARTDPWIQQLRAYHFARAMPGCMLAMDMGTGKTKVVIDLVTNLHLFRTLVIAPSAVAEDIWPDEIMKHGRVTKNVVAALVDGPVKKRTETADALLNAPTDAYPWRWIIINYEAVWREPFKSWALKQHWNLVVADESHRIKGAGSNVSTFLYRVGLRADRRLCLTGTPLPNGPMDAYGQYRFLDPGIFGTNFGTFQNEYAEMGGFENREYLRYRNQKRMMKKMHRIMYHVDADDVQDFPSETDTYRHAKLDPESRRIYKALDKEFIAAVNDGVITIDNVLVKGLRLQELTSGYTTPDRKDPDQDKVRYEANSVKAHLLLDTLNDIKRQPMVIFARFRWDLATIHEVIQERGWTSCELSGSANDYREWKRGSADVLVAQIQSGKEGLDFTRARYGIFYSLNFSLGDYRQMRKRIRRPGQEKPHTFIHLIISNTIDQEIMEAIWAKEEPVDYLLKKRKHS